MNAPAATAQLCEGVYSRGMASSSEFYFQFIAVLFVLKYVLIGSKWALENREGHEEFLVFVRDAASQMLSSGITFLFVAVLILRFAPQGI